jgi:8-oxo-dGTP pyrophosphatase MutT (NUDIX family)
MTAEYCAGAIIFKREGAEDLRYFLLRYPNRAKRRVGDEGKLQRRQTSSTVSEEEYWGFVKGHVEAGESLLETTVREVREETGLKDLKFIDGFKEKESYFFTKDKEKICKTVTFLLAETQTKDIVLSAEHLDSIWLPYQEALTLLTFKNAKDLLKKANELLLR